MTLPRSDFPYRHATRLVNAFQLAVGTASLSAHDHDFTASVLFMMVYRQALRAPGDRRVSINGIATSLKQSTETMRRAASTLVAHGTCRAVDRGVERVPDFIALPLVERSGDAIDTAFRKMLDDYRICGLPLPNGLDKFPKRARLEAALDIQLSALELDETRNSRLASLHIIGAVAVLNAAILKEKTELGLLYGYDDTVPPDDLRLPVGAAQIVLATGLPKTTVWRHLAAAETSGALRRVPAGFLLGERYMHDPLISRLSRTKINYVHRVLHDLASGRYGQERRSP